MLAGLADGQIALFETTSLNCKVSSPFLRRFGFLINLWACMHACTFQTGVPVPRKIRLGFHPICSMFNAKKKFWFSHGPQIVVFKNTDLGKEETRWPPIIKYAICSYPL